MHTIADKKLLMLKPDDIIPSTNRPRKNFDAYELQGLADSIASSGIIQPLTVRKGEDGKYILISGERRLRAAKSVGLRRVPCVLHRTDETAAALYSLIENMQRSSLDYFEEADAIMRLITEFNLSQSEVSVRLGMAGSAVSNKLRLLKLSPEIKERLSAAGLTEHHARALLRLPAEQRDGVLDKIIAEDLNLYQAEELINGILNPEQPPLTVCDENKENGEIKPIRKASIGNIKLFSNSLSKLLATVQNAGIEANSKKHETDKYIEYKVRIFKNTPQYDQLKIC